MIAPETARLSFRKPDASDLAPYTAYCQSERARFVGGPFDAAQAFEKLAAMIGHWTLRGFGRFVFCDRLTGRAIGHVGALHLDAQEVPELTWTIWNGADEGRGFAHEASEAYLAHAGHALGFSAMKALVKEANLPSRRLAERIGGSLDHQAKAPDWYPGSVTYTFKLPR